MTTDILYHVSVLFISQIYSGINQMISSFYGRCCLLEIKYYMDAVFWLSSFKHCFTGDEKKIFVTCNFF